ncbi:MAG: uroporphyrinogen-III synthase [Chloroflexota bacterium]|nr:uroporphyrinogen-III synthase [Chloroflexota bacterium]
MRPTLLVTRPRDQAAELHDLLRERGLATIGVPTVTIDRSGLAAGLDRMLERLADADWLVLTSANGAHALADRLRVTGRRLPPTVRVAAVGPATADALRNAGISVDHVPATYLTLAIADGLGEVRGRKIVLARADAATPALRDALIARGAVLEEVIAYRTLEAPDDSRDLLGEALRAGLDGVTFTSSSTVRGLLRLALPAARARVHDIPAFCIGPVTAQTATAAGFTVAAVAAEHTAAGLADTIADHFAREDR